MGEINYAPLIDDMVWSYSRIKAFVDCPYRFYLKYIRHIHGKDNFTDEYSFNIESVPAERAAVILCQKDNVLYDHNDKFIYSNQWIPLSAKCTIQEKLRLCSILDEKCSGGSIAHINLESNFPNTDMAWEMLNKIARSGVIYFAFNTRINECKHLMAAVRAGGARRIIVYRLDRISRSVLDFANVISELQKYGVEFVSITERFDTSTPIGKAMLMIVMVFAQLERETIQQRVMDAYRSRSRKGFYMGGRVPYGFELENTVMEGIKTCMYKPIPEQIQVVQLIFSLYAMPQVSFADVVRYLSQNGIKNPNGKNFSRMRIRDIITNPVYAKADASIFEFFHGQGTEIINDISQFIGTNGAYLYTGNKAAKRKSISLDGHVLVLAPHAGCIDADTWIRCRRKCLNVRQIAKPVKAKNTWLAGKIKCIDCGHALSLKSYPRKRSADARYYICNSKYVSASCDGVGAIQAAGIEDIVFDEMSRKLKEFNKLSYKEKHGDPIELTKLKIRAEEIEKEIATLIDKIVSASTATMEYINERIDALDEEKKTVKEKIAQMSAEMYDRQNIGVISDYMSKWNDISIDDKLTVVDTLIESIHVGHGKVKIAWKI